MIDWTEHLRMIQAIDKACYDALLYGRSSYTVHGSQTGSFGPDPDTAAKAAKNQEEKVTDKGDNSEGFSYKRLIKLLGMTTSAADGEALAAIRMANKELDRLGKTWHEFIMSKVVVVADPFDKIETPPQRNPDPHNLRRSDWASGATAPQRPAPPPPRRPAPTYTPPTYTPPEDFAYMAPRPVRPPRQKPDPFKQTSGRPAQAPQPSRISNRFAGLCVKCKERVGPGEGEAFVDGKFASGKDKWSVEHNTCPTKPKPAPQRPGTISDLDNMIS